MGPGFFVSASAVERHAVMQAIGGAPRGVRRHLPVQDRPTGHDLQGGVVTTDHTAAVDDQGVAAWFARGPHQRDAVMLIAATVLFQPQHADARVSIRTIAVRRLWITADPPRRIVGWRCQRRDMRTIDWPFRAAEQLDVGALTFRELRRFHFAIYPGVWAPRGVDLSANDRARAAWLWSRRHGVIAGLSASAMLGAKWVEPGLPAELIHTNRRPPRLISVHTDGLSDGETRVIDDIAVTTPARTAFDLGRRLALKQGVQRIDALMNATDVKVDEIATVIDRHPGVRGLKQLLATIALVDGGAESPYESLTRVLLVQAGFPNPETQTEFRHLHIRVDMGGANGKWKLNTTVFSTGRMASSGRGTSSESPCWKPLAGSSSG